MKLANFEIYAYNFPTTLGFNRKGFIVRLIDESGKEGAGEIAPLPGRSIETLDQALAAIKQIRMRFLTGDFSPAFFPPSVMFGMEMALSEFLFPDLEPIQTQVYRNKLKLKDLSVLDAVKICKAQSKPLRIDLNSQWELTKTIEFCSHFKPEDFIYIEDPVSLFTDLEKFYDQTGIPYALDEYLSHHPLERILSLPGLTHLIIKPTLHGGLTRCKAIQKASNNKTLIFSSAYETPIGLAHIARIAASLSPKQSHGLATESIFTPPLEIKKGHPIPWHTLEKVYL
jgi:O-succinylbenzoate synthase